MHGSFEVEDISCVFGGLNLRGPLNDIWCFDHGSLSVRTMQWTRMITSGAILEPRYRFAFAQFVKENITYFAVFGGNSKQGRLEDLNV